MKKSKAFTLIELVSVLVILAILALIVTPLVLNIIKKARTAAYKRSIDAYGRSIELAVASYLLDNGTFPTSIDELQVEYSGDKVACANKGINEDGTIYLTECTVNGRVVEGYTYGNDNTPTYEAYSVGDEIAYNNVDYYVIKDSSAKESTVTLLKAEPLTTAEVNQYGAGHVNMYACQSSDSSCYQTAYDNNGYGGMAYYSSSTCGWNGSDWVYDGCTTEYASSEIKYVVDSWKIAQASGAIEARLTTMDELIDNLGYSWNITSSGCPTVNDDVPSWIYNSNYSYWTMSLWNDSAMYVWGSYDDIGLNLENVMISSRVVRPVITIQKSALN